MKQEWIQSWKEKKISFRKIRFMEITFRLDRPIKVLIRNDKSPYWFVTIRENREDNWEKNSSISFVSPPHIKQRRIRRSDGFLFGYVSWLDKTWSNDNRSCSIVISFELLEFRLTIGMAKNWFLF